MPDTDTAPLTIPERLAQGGFLISDGATGTYLQQHGLEPGGCPEAFNATHPDVVKGMAKAYFDAGSDMVLTNSFGGSKFMQKKYGFGDRVREFDRLSAEHARSQTPAGCYVIGSVGADRRVPGAAWRGQRGRNVRRLRRAGHRLGRGWR